MGSPMGYCTSHGMTPGTIYEMWFIHPMGCPAGCPIERTLRRTMGCPMSHPMGHNIVDLCDTLREVFSMGCISMSYGTSCGVSHGTCLTHGIVHGILYVSGIIHETWFIPWDVR